ncbi:MAG: PEPxxWA-CTERM sorting domain-containing protein [Pseudomonadota bacterium]
MRIRNVLLTATASAAALLTSTSASAATYLFNINGPQSIFFKLNSSPTPTVTSPGLFFRVDGVTGKVNGANSTFNLGFGTTSYPWNFGFLAPSVGSSFVTTGPQLFTGTVAAPTFKLGKFETREGYTISISSAVPEPGTWVMMLFGIGAIGAAMRYRRRNVKVSFA